MIDGARSIGLRNHRIVDLEIDRALRTRPRDRSKGDMPLLVRVDVREVVKLFEWAVIAQALLSKRPRS